MCGRQMRGGIGEQLVIAGQIGRRRAPWRQQAAGDHPQSQHPRPHHEQVAADQNASKPTPVLFPPNKPDRSRQQEQQPVRPRQMRQADQDARQSRMLPTTGCGHSPEGQESAGADQRVEAKGIRRHQVREEEAGEDGEPAGKHALPPRGSQFAGERARQRRDHQRRQDEGRLSVSELRLQDGHGKCSQERGQRHPI